MEYRIFPAVGIARLGNSPEFFVGPEVAGSLGRNLGAGGETEVTAFADATNRKRKQAARFNQPQDGDQQRAAPDEHELQHFVEDSRAQAAQGAGLPQGGHSLQ